MTQKERMLAGLFYDPNDEDIMDEQGKCLGKLYDFNVTCPSEGKNVKPL